MKRKYNCLIILIVFILVRSVEVAAQPFLEEIQLFKKQDSVSFPPKNAILFIGSSSFTNWKDVQEYFPHFTIINRGFGGSSVSDLIRYIDDIIYPYQPKQIVIYCGENDLAASDTVTGKMVYSRFVQLFEKIRLKLPGISVVFISLKPSPSRWYLKDKMAAANSLIKRYLLTKKKTSFVNVYSKMLDADGTPMKDIFLEDELHMNAKGYIIWQKLLQKELLK